MAVAAPSPSPRSFWLWRYASARRIVFSLSVRARIFLDSSSPSER